jgi:GH15 family glucan-1,4-alpha-glucosidase
MTEAYKPISDYAAIGNLRTAVLVGRDGSIDWCCFPHLDCASVFAAILDTKKGGRFKVSVLEAGMGEQHYVGDTNVLNTIINSKAGKLSVIDFMPLSGNIHGCGGSDAPEEIHRILECEGDEVEVEVEWSPRFDYARALTRIVPVDGGWLAEWERDRLTLCGLDDAEIKDEEFGSVLRARFRMRGGERRVVVTRWNTDKMECRLDESMEALRKTLDVWEEWIHREGVVRTKEWTGECFDMVMRSELVLKLMTHVDTGAIAAAPTTSLPETIGGVRNWDYRFTWIRDAAMTAQALISMGHDTEAVEFLSWMERVSAAKFEEEELSLQIMYGLHGERDLKEHELSHLEGYRGSRPVRIGNEASEQFQLEVFGELLNMGYELARRGIDLESSIQSFLARVADHVQEVWEQPDFGIWEIRREPTHQTYSKVMAWVALDRAIHLSEDYGFPGNIESWSRTRDSIREQVLEYGYNHEVGAFVHSYDSKELDAANLRIPLLELLPFDDPRVQGTIDRTLEHLTENGLVYRYKFDDGLPGEEGAFGLCTFWLVDVLALSNRLDEAWEIFRNIAGRANHVGLFSEQIDAKTGEFLGNFPQAFTHIGLINSVLYLAYAEGREMPEYAPIGTPEHRAALGHSEH